MKEPLPPKSKPAAPPKPQGARSSGANRIECLLKVRYYCIMRPNRVQPLVVEVREDRENPPSKTSNPIVIRPVIGGALVAPAEQTLDVSRPGEQAVFQVTPLARGRLRDARVDVLQQGRRVGQIGLRTKSASQRRTWILLLLAFLIPWLILMYTHQHYYQLRATGRDLGLQERPDLVRSPGDVLERRINNWTTVHVPKIPYLHDGVLYPTAKVLNPVYDWACKLADDHLYFWVFLALLGLTVVSWIGRIRWRPSRYRTVQLAAVPAASAAAETLPLSPREQQAPVMVKPVE